MKSASVLLIFSFLSLQLFSQVIYVTPLGGGSRNGSNWANAFSGQQFADTSYSLPSGTEVWFAGGTYLPTRRNDGGMLTPGTVAEAVFVVNRGVKFYGGFAGTELVRGDRNLALIHSVNETVLTGDFGTTDHTDFVLIMPACGAGEVLDGITVSGAYTTGIDFRIATASLERPIINNCIVRDNGPWGNAGIHFSSNAIPFASADIMNSMFIANFCNSVNAGAIYTTGIRLRVINCVFYSNSSQPFFGNAASCIHFANVAGGEVSNSIFYLNGQYPGNINGVAILLSDVTDSVYINNSIFWQNYRENNVSNIDVDLGNNLSSVKNCIFQTQSMYAGPATISNSINLDPLFVNQNDPDGLDNKWGTSDDGLTLQSMSPAIDIGRNELIPEINVTDILSNARVTGCRVDIGAYEFDNYATPAVGLYDQVGQSCTAFPVIPTPTVYSDSATCRNMVSVLPNGPSPVSGIVEVCVTHSAAVPVYNGIPYVPRHYDVIPQANAANATARLTIYFTQQDFDLYNAFAPNAPQLPTGPTDLAGIANIQIEQDHGISLTGVPGSYNGTTVFINPDDNDVIWNVAGEYWEISFEVTGFSGFFLTTLTVVPVQLHTFSGRETSKGVELTWQTEEELNVDRFFIERSSNGLNFNAIGQQYAHNNLTGSSYLFTDRQPLDAINYYRVVSMDRDGSSSKSNVISIKLENGSQDVTLHPNPVREDQALKFLHLKPGKLSITLFDIDGRKIKNLFVGHLTNNSLTLHNELRSLSRGVYTLMILNNGYYTQKQLIID